MINPSKILRVDYFDRSIVWTKQEDVEYPYVSTLQGITLKIRLNDFPDEPLYTLIVEGVEAANFDEWPKTWRRSERSTDETLARDVKDGTLSGFVGGGTELTGEATFKAMLRVDGHLSGKISSGSGTLIVGANGKVDANIEVAVVIIHGTVNGDIIASQRLELGRAAKVHGNIQTPSLLIEQGAILEGSCRMLKMSTKEHRSVDSSHGKTEETKAVEGGFLEGFIAEIKNRETRR